MNTDLVTMVRVGATYDLLTEVAKGVVLLLRMEPTRTKTASLQADDIETAMKNTEQRMRDAGLAL